MDSAPGTLIALRHQCIECWTRTCILVVVGVGHGSGTYREYMAVIAIGLLVQCVTVTSSARLPIASMVYDTV